MRLLIKKIGLSVLLLVIAVDSNAKHFTMGASGRSAGQYNDWSTGGGNDFFSSLSCIAATIATAEWNCGRGAVPAPPPIKVEITCRSLFEDASTSPHGEVGADYWEKSDALGCKSGM